MHSKLKCVIHFCFISYNQIWYFHGKKDSFGGGLFFLDIRLNETTTFLEEKKKRSQLVYTRCFVHIQSGSFRTFLINQMSMFTHWKRRFLTHSFSVIFRTFVFIGALRFWLHKYLKLDNKKKTIRIKHT